MNNDMNNGAMYSVGQKVRVIDYMPKSSILFGFQQEMLDEYGGKEVTISYVGRINKKGELHTSNYPSPCDNLIYYIEEDNGKYYWSNTMFTLI